MCLGELFSLCSPMVRDLLIKLSGEYLGSNTSAYSADEIQKAVSVVAAAQESVDRLVVVVGSGNIWRGRETADMGIESGYRDQIGMMATNVNALVLVRALQAANCRASGYTALGCDALERYEVGKVRAALNRGEIVVLGGGTGNSGFSTDTTMVQRALDLGISRVLKLSTVDGIYDKDPHKYTDAKRYDRITYDQAIHENLQVMDQTAFALAKAAGLEVVVSLYEDIDRLKSDMTSTPSGTLVHNGS